jgi:RsiW-degrading membrane proteinase PrsW (M82 family)
MVLSLLALAVAPGCAIVFYIYWKDKYDKEPLKNLIICFVLGMLCIVPAIFIQTGIRPTLAQYFPNYTISYYSIFAFLVVALSEELCKFLALRFYAFRHKSFDEPFDGITYSVIIGMGFATLENIEYVFKYGFTTGVIRMFLSVPAHATFAVLMGFHTGLAKFDPKNSVRHLAKGLLLATFFHGAFDFFLFLQDSPQVTRYISGGLLIGGAVVSYIIAITMSLRSIKLHHEISRQAYLAKNSVIS